MKTRFVASAVVLAMAVLHCTAAPSPEELKSQVIAVYDASVAAAEARDVDALLRTVAENNDGALILNGTLLMTRDDVVKATRANFGRLVRLKYDVRARHVTLLGPDAALLVTDGIVTAETGTGQTIVRPFAHSVVYVRDHGSWRVLHAHQSNPREEDRP